TKSVSPFSQPVAGDAKSAITRRVVLGLRAVAIHATTCPSSLMTPAMVKSVWTLIACCSACSALSASKSCVNRSPSLRPITRYLLMCVLVGAWLCPMAPALRAAQVVIKPSRSRSCNDGTIRRWHCPLHLRWLQQGLLHVLRRIVWRRVLDCYRFRAAPVLARY